MRFAALHLERYGHFEDRELVFRSGTPDLHIIYGSNEAGKTTALNAIADLLFGFPSRSPYNFVFDYSLLRVGAVVEEGGQSLNCRRKKGTSNTLIDDADIPLDEAPLLAMLRGQTRDSFGLSFSLSQDRLRAGGRAMVEAEDDVGRALFAAGSGLTGVSDELARLEEEADAIWGPRAASRRSFTRAQREYTESSKLARDRTLKPKVWLDARAVVADTKAKLDEVQKRRDSVLAETTAAERIRRIAAAVRMHAEQSRELETHHATVDISPARADAAKAAMNNAKAAARDKEAAEKLVRETIDKMSAIAVDTTSLDHAEQIVALSKESGAMDLVAEELAQLKSKQLLGAADISRLREDAGGGELVPPSRLESMKLRGLAAAHAEDTSKLDEIKETEEKLSDRNAKLAKNSLDKTDDGELVKLATAVNAARKLGEDADERCEKATRKSELAKKELDKSIERLSPWTGGMDALEKLPRVAPAEVDEVRIMLAALGAEKEKDRQVAIRARNDAEAVTLQIDHLASGTAVSMEEIETARAYRTAQWNPIKQHVVSGAALTSKEDAVAEFEREVARFV